MLIGLISKFGAAVCVVCFYKNLYKFSQDNNVRVCKSRVSSIPIYSYTAISNLIELINMKMKQIEKYAHALQYKLIEYLFSFAQT